VRLVEEVYKAALQFIGSFRGTLWGFGEVPRLRDHNQRVAGNEFIEFERNGRSHRFSRRLPEPAADTDPFVYSAGNSFQVGLDSLGGLYDKVAGWWVPDTPPSAWPGSPSVLQALLVTGARLLKSLQTAAGEPFGFVWRWVVASFEDIDAYTTEAALMCEASAMSRRAPVWVNFFNAPLSYAAVLQDAAPWPDWCEVSEKPWDTMTAGEKIEWAARLRSANSDGREKLATRPTQEVIAARAARLHAKGLAWKLIPAALQAEFGPEVDYESEGIRHLVWRMKRDGAIEDPANDLL
jgi:hypothetical protein